MNRSFRSSVLAALLVSVGVLVGACGGSSSSSSTGGSSPTPSPTPSPIKIAAVDACKLVSVDDAVALTGSSTLTNQAQAQIPGACIYVSTDGATSVVVYSQLFPDATAANAVSAQQFSAAFTLGLGNSTVVNGVGDKAVEYTFTAQGSSGVMIFVFKANVVFMIATSPAPTDATQLAALQKKLETLAGKAADSLH